MLKTNRIDTELLKSLDPCQDRLDNWLKHYSTWSGTLVKFLSLRKISYADKIWVVFKPNVLDKKDFIELACRLAESVLPIFQSKYPNDNRAREVIIAARNGNNNPAVNANFFHAYVHVIDATKAVGAAARAALRAGYAAANAAISASRVADAAYEAAYESYEAAYCACAYAAIDATHESFEEAHRTAHRAPIRIIIQYLKEISERQEEKS